MGVKSEQPIRIHIDEDRHYDNILGEVRELNEAKAKYAQLVLATNEEFLSCMDGIPKNIQDFFQKADKFFCAELQKIKNYIDKTEKFLQSEERAIEKRLAQRIIRIDEIKPKAIFLELDQKYVDSLINAFYSVFYLTNISDDTARHLQEDKYYGLLSRCTPEERWEVEWVKYAHPELEWATKNNIPIFGVDYRDRANKSLEVRDKYMASNIFNHIKSLQNGGSEQFYVITGTAHTEDLIEKLVAESYEVGKPAEYVIHGLAPLVVAS